MPEMPSSQITSYRQMAWDRHRGIQVNAQDNLVAFNSINNLSTNQSSQGIVITNGTGQTVKNNIFSTPNWRDPD